MDTKEPLITNILNNLELLPENQQRFVEYIVRIKASKALSDEEFEDFIRTFVEDFLKIE